MNYEFRILRRSDIAQVIGGWNVCLPYDKITEEKFESIVFGDPNFEGEGNIVATLDHMIIGFSAAVAREGVVGRDGKGQDYEKDFGYIKGLFVLDEHREESVKRTLLERALRFLKSKGKKTVKVGQYTGIYFFPESTKGMRKS